MQHRSDPIQKAGIAVRRLTADDGETFRELRLEGLRDHPEAFSSSLEEENIRPIEWFSERIREGYVLGAFLGEQLVGVAGLDIPPSAKTRHKGRLWGMYVRAAARRMNVARTLIAAVLEAAVAHVEEVTLGVGLTNAAAIACYRSAGFEVYGLDPRAIKVGSAYVDELLMGYRLRSHGATIFTPPPSWISTLRLPIGAPPQSGAFEPEEFDSSPVRQ